MADEKATLRTVRLIPDSTPAVYANVCNVVFTPEEAILQFGQRNPESPDTATPVVTIYTPLPHVKRLAAVLVQQIEQYERNLGPIAADPTERLTPSGRRELGLDKETE